MLGHDDRPTTIMSHEASPPDGEACVDVEYMAAPSQRAVKPPSTTSEEPVTKPDSSLAR
jgi:hypothetical protein